MNAHELSQDNSASREAVRFAAFSRSVREILLISLILSILTALCISLANEYFSQQLWYLPLLAARDYFILSLAVLSTAYLVLAMIRKILPGHVGLYVTKLLVIAGCIYLSQKILQFADLASRFVESARKAVILHYAFSVMLGLLAFYIIGVFVRKRDGISRILNRLFVPALILALLLSLLPAFGGRRASDNNIILITIDTLRKCNRTVAEDKSKRVLLPDESLLQPDQCHQYTAEIALEQDDNCGGAGKRRLSNGGCCGKRKSRQRIQF
jgi:hypothetical protein